MATVRIPTVLRPQAGGQKQVDVEGSTVQEVLQSLVRQHPDLREQLFTGEGELNRFVNVYLNGADVRYGQGLDAAVGQGDTVIILPAMAGG
jgi:sulfur-carrier protein